MKVTKTASGTRKITMSKREWKQIGKSAQWISGGEGDEEIEAQYDEDRRDMKKDNEDKIRDEQDSTHASLKYKRVEADLLNSLEDAKSAAENLIQFGYEFISGKIDESPANNRKNGYWLMRDSSILQDTLHTINYFDSKYRNLNKAEVSRKRSRPRDVEVAVYHFIDKWDKDSAQKMIDTVTTIQNELKYEGVGI